jgi:hypothetical protein
MKKNIIITEKQFENILTKLNESGQDEPNYMVKQQLFTIATLAYKMWESLEEENKELEDWMTSKIAQSEASITSVAKSFMYDDASKNVKGMDCLNFDDIVIGN